VLALSARRADVALHEIATSSAGASVRSELLPSSNVRRTSLLPEIT
jgi:hypothetical protein